jgi:hypothetical protein
MLLTIQPATYTLSAYRGYKYESRNLAMGELGRRRPINLHIEPQSVEIIRPV